MLVVTLSSSVRIGSELELIRNWSSTVDLDDVFSARLTTRDQSPANISLPRAIELSPEATLPLHPITTGAFPLALLFSPSPIAKRSPPVLLLIPPSIVVHFDGLIYIIWGWKIENKKN